MPWSGASDAFKRLPKGLPSRGAAQYYHGLTEKRIRSENNETFEGHGQRRTTQHEQHRLDEAARTTEPEGLAQTAASGMTCSIFSIQVPAVGFPSRGRESCLA